MGGGGGGGGGGGDDDCDSTVQPSHLDLSSCHSNAASAAPT